MTDTIDNASHTNAYDGRDDLNDSSELGAWILPVSQDLSVAVGRYELKYIEYITAGITLPGVPAYCEQGFLWRNRFIPALDIYSLISRRRTPSANGEQLAAIVAYENAAGDISVGAILLRGIPKLIGIAPEQSVEISKLSSEWHLLAQAAFQLPTESHTESDFSLADKGKIIDNNLTEPQSGEIQNAILPVLDLRLLFDTTPADLLALH